MCGQMPGAQPYWKDRTRGAMKRAAHWLATEVGEGNKFSKADLREAVPEREQVDRRARHLRRYGWVIDTYRERADLASGELLLVKIGDPVWEKDYRPPKADAVSAAMRRRVFDRDGNRCRVCGIAAGEEYPTLPGVHARLTVGHLTPTGRKGSSDPNNFRTECSICNEPARHLTEAPVDVELVKARVRELPRRDKRQLAAWMRNGQRTFSGVESLWSQIRQIPAPQREEVRQLLENLTAAPAADEP